MAQMQVSAKDLNDAMVKRGYWYYHGKRRGDAHLFESPAGELWWAAGLPPADDDAMVTLEKFNEN